MTDPANPHPNSVVRVTRDGAGKLHAAFARVDVGDAVGTTGLFRLRTPHGWQVEPLAPRCWRVTARHLDLTKSALFSVERVATTASDVGRRSVVSIPYVLELENSLDIADVALPQRNRADDLGEVRPSPVVFARTWPRLPRRLARLLFEGIYSGIYSDVVFLSSGPRRGGLCSGMARWAIARAQGLEPDPGTAADAVRRIEIFHGRQMQDRALLAALPWFLRGSSAAAFRAVRRDLLRDGVTDRALDLAVPTPWRRDLATAIVAEGHTVVPLRLHQAGTRHGYLDVYDPNHPEALRAGPPRRITFDLARNRYAYGTLVSMADANVGMIASREGAFARPGTAMLALLGSLVLTPRRGVRSLLRGMRPTA
jgi:hypothetical protein